MTPSVDTTPSQSRCVVFIALMLVMACSRSAGTTGTASADTATASVPPASATSVPSGHATGPDSGRAGTCVFLRFEGTGKDKETVFRIDAGAKAASVVAHGYAYDKGGKQLPLEGCGINADVRDFDDKLKEELSLQCDLPAQAVTVECELKGISYTDGTSWCNANLAEDERPKGGLSSAELKKRSGEKVRATIVFDKNKKSKLRLENVSDKEVKSLVVWFRRYMSNDLSSAVITGEAGTIEITIKPGATVEKQDHTLEQYLPVEPGELVEFGAVEVTFSDGSTFRNKTLADPCMPAQSRPATPSR